MTLDELRQIASKHFPHINKTSSDYQLHSLFVSAASEAADVTRHCQKLLDKKYRAQIRQQSKLREERELEDAWQTALDSGDVTGAYWAIVTHPCATDKLLERVFGEIHMLSHLSGASTRTSIKNLGELRRTKQQIEQELAVCKSSFNLRLAEKQNEIDALKAQNAESQHQISALKKTEQHLNQLEESNKHEQLSSMVDSLSNQLFKSTCASNVASRKIKDLERTLNETHSHSESLKQQLEESLAERSALESSLMQLLARSCDKSCNEAQQQSCQRTDLSGRRILYVGGRVNQCPYFRTLVEEQNGTFFYHDGGKEDNRLKLNGALAQADAILCPTDCISHDAYARIKRHCDHQAKQLILIPHASLSSFAKGLTEITAHQRT